MYRPGAPFRALNLLGGLMGEPLRRAVAPLDADRLFARARRRTGLRNAGGDGFLAGLRVQCDSLEREAGLGLLGRFAFREEIERLIANRLLLFEDLRREPAIAGRPTPRPIFIVGYPRTGTTLLHQLLTLHPGTHSPLLWRLLAPSPPPEPGSEARDPRLRAARRRVWLAERASPILPSIHELDAEGPEECVFLIQDTLLPFVRARVPSFMEWILALDPTTEYEHHRRQLQVLQWGRPEGRWVLKSPFHLTAIDAILRVYPDACIVMTHRDPLEVAPSFCSLFAAARALHAPSVDPARLGGEALELLGTMMDRFLDARARHSPARFFDVDFRKLMEDPAGMVRSIHEHFGFDFDADFPEVVRRRLEERPRHRRGAHRYSPEMFGLDAARIRKRFERYEAARREALA